MLVLFLVWARTRVRERAKSVVVTSVGAARIRRRRRVVVWIVSE